MSTKRGRPANTSLEFSWAEVVFELLWSEQPVELLCDFVFEPIYTLLQQQSVTVNPYNSIVD